MIQEPKVFSFVQGKKYTITNKKDYHAQEKDRWDNPIYTFVYVKRINKLHIFKEVNFGWTKGLSDTQIANKDIKEVK